jgi:hypothetical protein
MKDLEWTRMMRGARTLMDDCASVRPGEKILVAAAYERDAEPILTVIKPRERVTRSRRSPSPRP